MIKMILVFVVLTVLIAGGISLFRTLANKERWTLTKNILFAMLCSALSVIVLTTIVILF